MSPLSHQGAFDASAALDIIASQCQFNSVALPAGGTIAQNLITGALDIVLVNTTNTPGTVTTRTATQLFTDWTAQFGLAPANGTTWFLTIVHAGTGTLTLAGGTGVTVQSANGSGTTTVATQTARDYIVVFTSPTTVTINALGAKNS